MNFIDKLIEETIAGDLDFVWEYYGNERFKYSAKEHPLRDLNFSLLDIIMKEEVKPSGKTKVVPDNTKAQIIFPNGAAMEVSREKLEVLYRECANAIFRAVNQISNDYANGITQEEIEKQKQLKSKEKPADEEQTNKPEV